MSYTPDFVRFFSIIAPHSTDCNEKGVKNRRFLPPRQPFLRIDKAKPDVVEYKRCVCFEMALSRSTCRISRIFKMKYAPVVELADTMDLGAVTLVKGFCYVLTRDLCTVVDKHLEGDAYGASGIKRKLLSLRGNDFQNSI
jgi:hypothetical protein